MPAYSELATTKALITLLQLRLWWYFHYNPLLLSDCNSKAKIAFRMKPGTKDCITEANFGKLKSGLKKKKVYFIGLLFKSAAQTVKCALRPSPPCPRPDWQQVWQGAGLKKLVPPQCGHGQRWQRCCSQLEELFSPATPSLGSCYVLSHHRLLLHRYWSKKV